MPVRSILRFLFMVLLLPSNAIFSQEADCIAKQSTREISYKDNLMTGYAVNSSGRIIYKTTDGGKSWLNQLMPSGEQIKPIFKKGKGSGSILKREVTNEGLIAGNPLTENNNDGFMPIDDYTNSSRQLTNIRFTLQFPGFVSIKIYDKEGNTIDELARSSFGSGSHEVKWNREKINTDGYFYSIVTSEFSETKKINLIK